MERLVLCKRCGKENFCEDYHCTYCGFYIKSEQNHEPLLPELDDADSLARRIFDDFSDFMFKTHPEDFEDGKMLWDDVEDVDKNGYIEVVRHLVSDRVIEERRAMWPHLGSTDCLPELDIGLSLDDEHPQKAEEIPCYGCSRKMARPGKMLCNECGRD